MRKLVVVATSLVLVACSGNINTDGRAGSGARPSFGAIRRSDGQTRAAFTPSASAVTYARELTEQTSGYVQGLRSQIGWSLRDDIIVKETHRSADGRDHVRLAQTFEGVPIWGGELL